MFTPLMHFQNLQAMTSASGYPNASYYAPQVRPGGPWPNKLQNPYANAKQSYQQRVGTGMRPLKPWGGAGLRPFDPLNRPAPRGLPNRGMRPFLPSMRGGPRPFVDPLGRRFPQAPPVPMDAMGRRILPPQGPLW